MGSFRRGWAIAALGLMFAGAPAANADDVIVGEVVLTLVPGATLQDIPLSSDVIVLGAVTSAQTYLLEFGDSSSDDDEFDDLLEHPLVASIEEHLSADLSDGLTQGIFYDAIELNYDEQYAWERIGTTEAHTVTIGTGITVAVLDTGVDTNHVDLATSIKPGGFNFVDGNGSVADVGNGIDDDQDDLIDESVGHGTMVAGLIRRTAPGVSILPIRVLDSDGRGDAFVVAEGIYHAINRGADVINLSLGWLSQPDVVTNAVSAARAAGVVVVAAAGNLDQSDPAHYPAILPDAIAVASVDDADAKSSFSSFGSHVVLSAPGTDVYSTAPGSVYAHSDGTSLAAALVSGAAALVRANRPEWTPEQIENHLALTSTNIDAQNVFYLGLLGAGRLDLAAAATTSAPTVLPGNYDLNGDDSVDHHDVAILLTAWGACFDSECEADVNASGSVDFVDLLLLLSVVEGAEEQG